jgi:hypothetical protein
MDRLDHLPLPEFRADLERKKSGGGSGYTLPEGRSKKAYAQTQIRKAQAISHNFSKLKEQYKGRLDPHLIFEINVNDKVDTTTFENELIKMGLDVLSVAEDKKGYWVVFASDEHLEEFRARIESHGKDGEGGATRYDFFNAISEIEDIPIGKKIAPSIAEAPLPEDEESYIDVELWRMSDDQLEGFITKLPQAIQKLRVTDKLIRNSFALLRVRLDHAAFKQLIELKEVARVSRPPLPTFNPFEIFNQDVEGFEILSPAESATGILIIDSGVVAGHPLIKNALGDEANFQSVEAETVDRAGHGTAVAGCALYGDIEKCINEKQFHAHNWLFSAKVMYAVQDLRGGIYSEYDPEKLMEHQFQDAIEYFLGNKDNRIRVVNVSLGNKFEVWHKSEFRQPPLASLIDEIAREYDDVVFVVSSGNIDPVEQFGDISGVVDHYPEYLFNKNISDFNLINPATSALAITVGSIANSPRIAPNSSFGTQSDIFTSVAAEHQPSPFTRTGPGINGMVKPELVDYGGNLILSQEFGRVRVNNGGKMPILSWQYPDTLFAMDLGSSFSAPKVARSCALVSNSYPDKSANFIKNLVLQSAHYPEPLDKTFWQAKKKDEAELKRLMSIGYGVPNHAKAISSFNNRVLFFDESSIQVDQAKVFKIDLPDSFFATKGDRIFSIVLTYNPPVRRSRGDYYLGNTLEFKVFHTVSPDDVISKISALDDEQGESKIDSKYHLDFEPKVTLRSKGCHQKAVKNFTHTYWSNNSFTSLCIALINRNRWVKVIDDNFKQDYCISLCVYHSEHASLYSEIRTLNQVQLRERARVR